MQTYHGGGRGEDSRQWKKLEEKKIRGNNVKKGRGNKEKIVSKIQFNSI